MKKQTQPEGDLSKLASKEDLKLEDTKLSHQIDVLRENLSTELESLRTQLREMLAQRQHQEENISKILTDLEQIAKTLEKVAKEQEFTVRILKQQENQLNEHAEAIRKIENELQKFRTVLRID
jgi:methyl-accepting chemotaxis protein